MTKKKDQQGLFLPLTPVIIPETQEHNSHESQEQKNIYFQALDESLTNNQVHNIALLGPYGSGKSSVIRSYIASRNLEEHTITVTLGNYENNQELSTGSNSTQTAYERNANSIERQIILQLSSQIPSHKIKGSPYAFHTDRTVREKVISLIAIASFFIGILALTSTQIYNLFTLVITYPYIDVIMFLMILFPVIYGVWLFLNSERFELSKINVNLGATSTELNKSSNHDETILDKDIKQIVNMLIRSQAKIVIFEDLDRFNDIEIFNKLKRINLLVNNRLKSNASDSKISFLYLSHDGLFTKADRTKYFDHIIPIVPILTTSTAPDYIKDELSKIQSKLKVNFLDNQTNFLEEISAFINDRRLANNVLNEFIIYYKQAEMPEDSNNVRILFARIVFKHLAPSEYELFRKGTGKVFNHIERISKLNKKEILSNHAQELDNFLTLDIKNFITFLINQELIYDFNNLLYDSSNNILDSLCITRNELDFVKNYKSKNFGYSYKLNNPKLVISQINDIKPNDDLTNLLNLDLIKYFCNNYNNIKETYLFHFVLSNEDNIIKLLLILDHLRTEEKDQYYECIHVIFKHTGDNIFLYLQIDAILKKLYSENINIDDLRDLASDVALYLLQNSKLSMQKFHSYINKYFTNSIELALRQSSEKDQIDMERIFAELQKHQIQLEPRTFPTDHYLYNRILQHNASFTSTSTPAHNEDEVTDDAQHK